MCNNMSAKCEEERVEAWSRSSGQKVRRLTSQSENRNGFFVRESAILCQFLTMRTNMPLFARPLLAVLMFTTVTAFTAISTRESISARTPTSVVWKDHAASIRKKRGARFSLHSSADRISEQEATQSDLLDPTVAEKFTVLVCSSDLCSQKRKSLRMDEYSTYSAFWSRIQDQAPSVQVKESPCLGSCKKAPCVAVVCKTLSFPSELSTMLSPKLTQTAYGLAS
jgi:hypothetical protein